MNSMFITRCGIHSKHEGFCLKIRADYLKASAGIVCWIAFDDSRRSYQALGQRAQMAVWGTDIRGGLSKIAGDMTRRLDSASALPPNAQVATTATAAIGA